MSNIFFRDGYLCYTDKSGITNKLFRLNNYLYNKSKISFHLLDMNGGMILLHNKTFLGKCVNVNQKMTELYQPDVDIRVCNELCAFFLAYFCTHMTRPANVACIGCEEATLYAALSIIGEYNPLSQVTIVQEEIQNNGENYFLSVLLNVETSPVLSLNVSDYHNTKLQENHFDQLVVDGKALEDNSALKLKEINRLYNGSGSVIFLLDNQPELFNQIIEMYNDAQVYNVSDNVKLITVKEKIYSDDRIVLSEKYQYLKYMDKFNLSDEQIREIVKQLENDIDVVAAQFDTEQKIKGIELKEYLISYMLFDDYKSYYLEQIQKML